MLATVETDSHDFVPRWCNVPYFTYNKQGIDAEQRTIQSREVMEARLAVHNCAALK